MPILFVPFGEFSPDAGWFSGDDMLKTGLVDILGLFPAHGDYFVAPDIQAATAQIGGASAPITYGHHVHAGSATAYSFVGSTVKLWEYGSALTDVTRAAGAYTTPDTVSGWQGTSFGDSVIMTNFVDDPQIQLTRGAQFVKLASSVFDPKFRYCFPIRNNLFIANLNLAAGYDGLSAGANPTLVAWSQSDAPRFFGSFRADPQYVGADYQPLNNDFGEIVGSIGGDFGIVFQRLGAVRIDGPPYQFRDLPGVICRYPNSIVRVGDDVYYWGMAGPTRLTGGQGFPEVVGYGRVARSLSRPAVSSTLTLNPAVAPIYVSGSHDPELGIILWSYSSLGSPPTEGTSLVAYSYRDDRFGFFLPKGSDGVSAGCLFMKGLPPNSANGILGQRFVERRALTNPPPDFLANFKLDALSTTSFSLTRAYIQPDPERTSIVKRVRPIINFDDPSPGFQVFLFVRSTSTAHGTAGVVVSGAHTTRDNQGWVVVPGGTKAANFHSISLSYSSNGVAKLSDRVHEFEGFEIDYELGGKFSA